MFVVALCEIKQMPRVYTARLEKSSDPNANEPVGKAM
jgi:hypothetical protein